MGASQREDRRRLVIAHTARPVVHRARPERGFTLVEAGFVLPVFMLLVIAVVEFGLLMSDYLAVSQSVRAGSRAASAAGNDYHADLYTVLRISQESTALSRGALEYIVIYKPNAYGEKPNATCQAGTPQAGVCNVYYPGDLAAARAQVAEETRHAEALAAGNAGDVLDESKLYFGCLAEGPNAGRSPDRYWCPTTRKVSLKAKANGCCSGTDFVGVYIKATHRWATKMFGSTKKLDDQSIIRLEPRSLADET